MQTAPDISIIVVTHNSSRWIQACLASLAAQQTGRSFEIIVVDNGSADGTPELVSRAFPALQLLRTDNRGFGAGCNRGAETARGGVLAFINPDTAADPHWLDEILRPLDAGRTVALAKTVLMDDPATVNTCGNLLHFTGYGFVNGFGLPAASFSAQAEVPGISGVAFAMHRADFTGCGGFDEEFFLYLEDTELSWRLRRRGFRFILAPDAVVRHRYRFEVSPDRFYHIERGRMLLLRKHVPPWYRAAIAPSLLLTVCISLLWALAQSPRGFVRCAAGIRDGLRADMAPAETAAPFRCSMIAGWKIPFRQLSASPLVRLAGALCNIFFSINYHCLP